MNSRVAERLFLSGMRNSWSVDKGSPGDNSVTEGYFDGGTRDGRHGNRADREM